MGICPCSILTNLIPQPTNHDYSLTLQTGKVLDVLILIFKGGDNSSRTKVNSWLMANTREQFSLEIDKNFYLQYLDQRDGKGTQHYWLIKFNDSYAHKINMVVNINQQWQGLTLRSLPELKLAQLLYQHRIPFLANTTGLVLPHQSTLSDTILNGRVEYDFILLKPLLRIELDGQHHLKLQQRQFDIANDRLLLSLGIPTLRFNATDILDNPQLILNEILSITNNNNK